MINFLVVDIYNLSNILYFLLILEIYATNSEMYSGVVSSMLMLTYSQYPHADVYVECQSWSLYHLQLSVLACWHLQLGTKQGQDDDKEVVQLFGNSQSQEAASSGGN